jgi:hypothetical protein
MSTIPPCTNYKMSEELSASFTMIVATVVKLMKRRTLNPRVGLGKLPLLYH